MSNARQFTNPIFLAKLIESESNNKTLRISIRNDQHELCSIGGNHTFEIDSFTDDRIIESGLLSSGFANFFFNYTESANPASKVRSFTMDADLGVAFKEILGGKNFLVPDTNVILDRIFSNLDFLNPRLTKSLKMKIPRLSVLELERFHQSKNGNDRDLARRKAWLGYGELLYLKQSGALSMRELNVETLLGFSQIKGTENVDSWIRREINEAKLTPRTLQAEAFMKREITRFDNYVFVTSDLTNALSSVSENIDTIHISRATNWKERLRSGNSKQISRLIITLSVLYENIFVEMNSQKLKFDGMWEGKTISNYANEQAYLTFLN